MKKITALAAVSIAVILSACATQVPYDRASAGNIRTIGLVTPFFPDDARVFQEPAGFTMGTIESFIQLRRNDIFNQMLERHDFVVRDAFLERVTTNLESDGYAVTPIELERPGSYFLNAYPSELSVDAYLDINVMNYGYSAAEGEDFPLLYALPVYGAGLAEYSPFRPKFALVARLVRASDFTVLMQDRILYNADILLRYDRNPSGVIIAPPPEFDFVDFGALEADPTKAVQGMQDAAFKTADALSNLMK